MKIQDLIALLDQLSGAGIVPGSDSMDNGFKIIATPTILTTEFNEITNGMSADQHLLLRNIVRLASELVVGKQGNIVPASVTPLRKAGYDVDSVTVKSQSGNTLVWISGEFGVICVYEDTEYSNRISDVSLWGVDVTYTKPSFFDRLLGN